jgi:hypothetical protein
MEIKVIRFYKGKDYTIGRMLIDGKYVCDILEDKDRGLTDSMSEEEIKKKKIYGETAIPTGKYKVVLDYSPKFKKILPHILNVKGFEGIRIHSGNDKEDTFGCLLVGYNRQKGKVLNSRNALAQVLTLMRHQEDITLIIE